VGGRLCTQITHLSALGALKGATGTDRATLLYMASVARDEDKKGVPAGTYFAGWEYLASCLGYDEYTPAAEQAVKRSIGRLTRMSLIRPLGRAGPGRRQGYLITLPEVFP
jgi:hypothetical protein